jgi:uncharacterized protein (DUF2147 family)
MQGKMLRQQKNGRQYQEKSRVYRLDVRCIRTARGQPLRLRRTLFFLFAIALLFIARPAHASERDSIVGSWNTEEHDAVIDIFKCGEKYCGRIRWIKEPNYTAEDKNGKEGRPKVDDRNPNPKLRDRPLVGIEMMYDFAYAGRNIWKGGRIYNPENGKTYSGIITLISNNTLHLRGFFIVSLLGRTTEWTRVDY